MQIKNASSVCLCSGVRWLISFFIFSFPEFLNVNDDEVAEDYDDGDGCPEDARVLENSGWSSRTRCVCFMCMVCFPSV